MMRERERGGMMAVQWFAGEEGHFGPWRELF